MGIWRFTGDNTLEPLERSPFVTEEALEQLVEAHPHMLFDGESLLVIGRQVATPLGRQMDLLLLDALGRTVVVEFKKDRTPREVIAQALEYTAYVSTLDYDAINAIAASYFQNRGSGWSDLTEAFLATFSRANEESKAQVLWNADQRIVVAAMTMTEDILAVARYLRGKGIDISAIKFDQWTSPSDEKLLQSERVVGDEPIQGTGAGRRLTEQEILSLATAKSAAVLTALLDGLAELGLRRRPAGQSFRFDLLHDGNYIWYCTVAPYGSETRRDTIYLYISNNGLSTAGLDPDRFSEALRKAAIEHSQAETQTTVLLDHGEQAAITLRELGRTLTDSQPDVSH